MVARRGDGIAPLAPRNLPLRFALEVVQTLYSSKHLTTYVLYFSKQSYRNCSVSSSITIRPDVLMLIIICIILFRISCNISALYAPNFIYYSQDHCQNNPVTLEMILYCNAQPATPLESNTMQTNSLIIH